MSGHKFTLDGQILEGAESRAAFNRDAARLNQLQLEDNWIREKLHLVMQTKPSSIIQRVLPADFFPAVMSRIDSWFFSGKFYLDVCK